MRETAHRLFGVRREFIQNLGTKDKRAAVRAAPGALAALQDKLAAVRAAHHNKPRKLTHQETWAIAGQWYRESAAAHVFGPTEL